MTEGLALTAEEVARLHADARPGCELISYGELGLPYFELRFRAQVLERKPLDPFAEYVGRSVALGVGTPGEIQTLLGLDRRVLEATVVDLVVKEVVRLGGDGGRQLTLTPRGAKVLGDAIEIEPIAMNLSVHYDGLLRQVMPPFGDFLQPRELKEHGVREIPLPSSYHPELHRIDARDVERAIRSAGGGREQVRDVLALKSMRRFRVFRPVVALVYRADSGETAYVDLAIDGQVSQRHSVAFAEAGLAKKLGIVEGHVERAEVRLAPHLHPRVAQIVADDDRAAKMRRLKRAMRAEEAPAAVDSGDAEVKKRARDIFDATDVKSIDTFEHPQYLDDALSNSRARLLIVSPWLRGTVMNRTFMDKLEGLLQRGVAVYLGWGISKDERAEPNADRRVLTQLEDLARRYPNLQVRRLGGTHAKILVSDDRYVVVTSFNWLSFRGDPKRTFRDERGTMVSKKEYVDARASEWLEQFRSSPAV